jgi:acyl CoA:acetate/3-ketoacid CoA transferase beta subunit
MNLSAIGDHANPKVQLIGSRGAPGNTVNHATSYWVPNHTVRTFVDRVDFISGVGPPAYIVTNLAVFAGMRLRSLHPGVTIDDVKENTGFSLDIAEDLGNTRDPTPEELEYIRR